MNKQLLEKLKKDHETSKSEITQDDFIYEMEQFEKEIWEGKRGYLPNPALIKIKFRCNFQHKNCRRQPEYTDGTLCYCWAHSIMIQEDKYK